MSLIPSQTLLPENHTYSGKVSWQSPSNIALVKYWGKRPVQIPANASISFTLSEAHTDTSIQYGPRAVNGPWVAFFFEGKEEQSFADRIIRYFETLSGIMPFLKQLSFTIESSNSFPHSSGIASSASSMSAVALCLCDIEQKIYHNDEDSLSFFRKASYLARLGSGSASRSVYPNLVAWGETDHIPESSDEYAISVNGLDPVFETFHDDVLIVSAAKKSVSSSAGHDLMNTNIFADNRYVQAGYHLERLLKSMREGDLFSFGKIVEDEALTLHALMMCSDPSYILMEPGTIEVIKRIRAFRNQSSLPVFFTLDAGPNVHILYPQSAADKAQSFIKNELMSFAHNGRIIRDRVGPGPLKTG